MGKKINHKRLRTWETTIGVCCLLAGLLAPLLGGLLTVIEWIVGAGVYPWIHVTSTGLFIVAIPLILFAGFCLDWAERHVTSGIEQTQPVTEKGEPETWQRNSNALSSAGHLGPNRLLMSVFQRKQP